MKWLYSNNGVLEPLPKGSFLSAGWYNSNFSTDFLQVGSRAAGNFSAGNSNEYTSSGNFRSRTGGENGKLGDFV